LSIDEPTTDAALARFENEKVDGYDLFILETLTRHGLIQIITDDGDFATIAGIQVFTANRNVLKSAHAQGKLLTR
jgi:predicted nucleic acid-binding protein